MPRISEIAASVGLLLLIGVISVDGLVKEGDYQNSLYQQNLESNSATGATASFPFLMPNVSPQTVSPGS